MRTDCDDLTEAIVDNGHYVSLGLGELRTSRGPMTTTAALRMRQGGRNSINQDK